MNLNIHNFLNNPDEFYANIKGIAENGDKKKLIGFYGQSDQKVMDIFRKSGYSFIDLDIDFKSNNINIVEENINA